MLSSYFASGTGRCGTLLLSKLLHCSEYTHCNHEYSIDTALFKKAINKDNLDIVNKDIKRLLHPAIMQHNEANMSYGECSGHLYPLFPELYRRYENTTRFILLTRNPADFVRSALARGFFNRDHPYPLEHVIPSKSTEIGARWPSATSLEKCAWYWAMVNGLAYRFFISIPHTLWKIVPIESMSIEVVKELYDFLHLKDFASVKSACETVLSVRHNATPGQTTEKSLNPYSQQIKLGPFHEWRPEQVNAFNKHVLPMQDIIYGNKSSGLMSDNNLCLLK